ncbi:alpha/beta-hydrolase [Mollisia scopiformis]|uniref:Alpha/beta-hydrolase n=1 Tax=Mollisia scopiformis TaxID=149040 RepID=A0A132B829_MOLSC|nr:alpha/beta-hydrolase [Mollisia scopiformis]KUJ08555.1 alpha/beta-hydrolase [Mollisia scopiformis]
MPKPTIVFIPGIWEGPTVFTGVSNTVSSLGFQTQAVSLPSTGSRSPGNPSMKDDEAAIRAVVKKLVEEEEKEVLMVMHSAGGFLGSAAIEGLGRKEGRKGGVVKLVFLCAGIAEVGHFHAALPFMDLETGKEAGEMHCVRPRELLFNDLSPEDTEKWLSLLKPQPLSGWGATTDYAGWKEIPSVYLICENDQVLPEAYQAKMSAMVGSKVERCKSGHMVTLSMPDKVVDVIRDAAEEV